MGLDRFGFPAAAVANSILVRQDDFGDSTKQLEESWHDWLHYNPFDYIVAEKLTVLYDRHLQKLDKKKDAARHQTLERKLKLTKHRAQRYHQDRFSALPPEKL